MWLTAAAGLGAALISGLVTYLVARRTSSGSIHTSEAKDLWAESTGIRRELREDVDRLRSEVDTLRREKTKQDVKIAGQEAVIAEQAAQIAALRLEVAQLRGAIGD